MPLVIIVLVVFLLSIAMFLAMILTWPVALLAGLIDTVGSSDDLPLTAAAWVAAVSLVAFGLAILVLRRGALVSLFSGRRRSEWSAPFLYGGVVYLIGGGAMGALLILDGASVTTIPLGLSTLPNVGTGPSAIVFGVAAVLLLAPVIRWTVVPAFSAWVGR